MKLSMANLFIHLTCVIHKIWTTFSPFRPLRIISQWFEASKYKNITKILKIWLPFYRFLHINSQTCTVFSAILSPSSQWSSDILHSFSSVFGWSDRKSSICFITTESSSINCGFPPLFLGIFRGGSNSRSPSTWALLRDPQSTALICLCHRKNYANAIGCLWIVISLWLTRSLSFWFIPSEITLFFWKWLFICSFRRSWPSRRSSLLEVMRLLSDRVCPYRWSDNRNQFWWPLFRIDLTELLGL